MDVSFLILIAAGCLIFPVGCAFIVIEDNVRAFAYSAIVIIFMTMAVLMTSYETMRSNGMTNPDGSYSNSIKNSQNNSKTLRKEWSSAVTSGQTTLGYNDWRKMLNDQWSKAVASNDTTMGYEDWVRRKYP